ncbi:MAG: SufE family protein [Actinomycetota bacterium]|nr:SufE family protein [Actinomycetota bacterium]
MATPRRLQQIVDMFAAASPQLRLEELLEYSRRVPPLPGRLKGSMERVTECQTPFFVAAEIDGGKVSLHFDAPSEAPTTRGFAGVLAAGLDGATTDEVLGTPNDFYYEMGLAEAISVSRLQGMSGILGRVKRQIREQLEKSRSAGDGLPAG